MVTAAAAAPAAAAPGTGPITRQAAQQLAREELAKAMYHPRTPFLTWLHEQLDRLFSNANNAVPGGWWAIIALIAAAVIVIALVLNRVGPVARARGRDGFGPLRGPVVLSAREHRELAERDLAAGDYSGAIQEYLRAIATGLEERAVLPPAPGRTAGELAAQAGRLLPGHAADLSTAARLFDDVRYGGREGTRADAERLRDLEAAIRAAQPATAQPAAAAAASGRTTPAPAGTR